MVVPTILYIIIAAAFAAAFPGLRIGALHTGWAQDLGAALLVLAAVLYVPVITAVRGAAEKGRLLTTGLFAYVRNPIYAAFIFMVCPGVALIAASWPAL
jgi:protein-S-isoprenylcysteine O-methyltransferase Ste14